MFNIQLLICVVQITINFNRMHTDQSRYERRSDNKFFNWAFEKRWYSNPTITSTYVVFATFGIIFLILAALMLISNHNIREARIQSYHQNQQCKSTLHSNVSCEVSFEIVDYMQKPIFVLYQLENFYQNHRRYAMSKSFDQLTGRDISVQKARDQCYPIVLNEDLNTNRSWGGVLLNPKAVANPCGLIAKSFFNDTYELIGPKGNQIEIDETGISSQNEKIKKYKRNANSDKLQWLDPQDEHFLVWMRTAGMPTFMNNWGTIHHDLQPGNYTLKIKNNYNVKMYNAGKSLILSTASYLGGKNNFVPGSLIISAIFCFAVIGVFFYKSQVDERFGKEN